MDVRSIRKQLGLTQAEFSDQYLIPLSTLKNWEQGCRTPDTAALAFLVCIREKPHTIADTISQNRDDILGKDQT